MKPSSLLLVLLQGTSARILETRKTAPGLRLPDKWAVLIGGGSNHRIGLFDMVMIKDNHVTSAGGVVPAIQHAQVCYPVTPWADQLFNYPCLSVFIGSASVLLCVHCVHAIYLCCLHDGRGTTYIAFGQEDQHCLQCLLCMLDSLQGLHWLEAQILLQDFVRRKHKNIPIEVETRTLDEVREVLQFLETDKHSLVKRLMLDNMTKLDSSAPGIYVLCMLVLTLCCKCTASFAVGFCKPFYNLFTTCICSEHQSFDCIVI